MSNTKRSQIPIQNSRLQTPKTIQNPSQSVPVHQQLPQTNWIPQQSPIIPQQVLYNTYMPSTSYISQIPQTQYVPSVQSEVIGVTQGEIIKGESRIEYVPYTKEVTEYVTQEVIEYVPRERKITDYYAIEYFTEVVPQVIQEKYIEYVPVETVKERTEYQAIYKQQIIEQPQQYQEIQYTEQPLTTYIQQPQQQQQYIASTTSYQPQYSYTQTQQYYQTFSPSVQPTIPISQSPSFIIQPSIGTTAWQPIVPESIRNLSSGQRLNGSIVPKTRGSILQ